MTDAIARLWELGQSPWYDNLTRDHVEAGLAQLIDSHGIRGVTSNPTIFDKAIAGGEAYDGQIAALAADQRDATAIYWELVTRDVGGAADVFAGLHTSSGRTDGFVSVEVDPDLAHDTEGTAEQARGLFARLNRPNVMIKIPATRAGLPAVTECIAAGLNVNITLIFSLQRYDEVIDAYLSGLEQRRDAGEQLHNISSVASFFVSRVDTETDRRLPDGHELRGQAAVANAKLAYRHFEERFADERWQSLAESGARVQRPLWASTSTKNPNYSPTLYVDTLIGPHTVNTLAPASIDALAATSADVLEPDTVRRDVEEAHGFFERLAAAGVDFADVTATLEAEGVASFSASFHDAVATVAKKAEQLSG